MKKPASIFIITAAVIALAFLLDIRFTKVIDWEESFDEKSNKPYGTSIFHKELKTIFKDQKLRTVYHTPSSYLYANSEMGHGEHVAKGNYIIIGHSNYIHYESVNALLSFAEAGNTVFISDYHLPQVMMDTLKLNVQYIFNEKDSTSALSFTDKRLESKNIDIDRNKGDYYFSEFDTHHHSILGHSRIDEKRVNFLGIPFGEGYIYLHLQPKVFTNYNLLKDNRYNYVNGLLSYLPQTDIYYDSYTKIYTSYGSDVEPKSDLGWFLEQTSFKWAWYMALLLTLLFMVFNAKRRQRVVKVIHPLQNTSVFFVKTISNLYFETQDHKNLIEKKMAYFLEHIRNDLKLDTSKLNDEFIIKLTEKSGKKKEQIAQLIQYISWLKSKNDFTETNLITLNKHIEAFYSK
ncbi:DUF4350 domain-containing protein [Mariniflexile ostreae]|uniref:DUF4350 domain-containing protein n=1 Tax=Mariniflexile ostreae TaxID=1520892 RepID=A0ABV5FAD2_9FLAO